MRFLLNLATRLPARYLVLLSFCGYVVLAVMFPLVPNFDHQPVADIRVFQPGLLGGLFYAFLILSLFFLHALLTLRIKHIDSPALSSLMGATLLLGSPLLFMYPINANDVYRYAIRGIISSQYGANPYEYSAVDSGNALFISLAGEWREATSPYGPLWELGASLLTSLGRHDLLFSLILFKFLGLLSLIAATALLWKIFSRGEAPGANSRNRKAAFTVLWAMNPALLLAFVGNAHNDALMIVFLLLGWLVISFKYIGPGFLILLAAVLIKPIALIALPIAAISSWKTLDGLRARVGYLVWVLAGSFFITTAAFLPFGNPESLFWRLLREASAGASFSPAALFVLVAQSFGWHGSFAAISTAFTAIFAAFYLWLLWRTWRRGSAEQNIAMGFWGYIVQALNFRIWYATWPFPWLLLDAYAGGRQAAFGLHAGLWFLVTSQLSVIIYGHLRTEILGGSQLQAHLIGVAFVFLLPFILAMVSSQMRLPSKHLES